MNNPKPIFTVGLPFGIGKAKYFDVEERLVNILTDYHVIVYPNRSDKIKFDAFYEKDFNEVKFEELKQLVKDAMQPKTEKQP